MDDRRWDGDYDKYFLDGSNHAGRTDKLIEALKILKSLPKYVLFEDKLEGLKFKDSIGAPQKFTIDDLIGYMRTHQDMIKYEFDDSNKLTKIMVHPYSLFTIKHDSKVRQCDMSTYITEFLKLVLENRPIAAVMVNKDNCKSVEGSAEYKAAQGDTPVAAGGSKSRRRRRHRRKPVRKTRHKSKSKPRTHRRRRHSRVRKHKKYTSRTR